MIHRQALLCGEDFQELNRDLVQVYHGFCAAEATVGYDAIQVPLNDLRVALDDLDSFLLHLGGLITMIESRLDPDETTAAEAPAAPVNVETTEVTEQTEGPETTDEQ